MDAGDRAPRGGVQAIDRAVQILRCFDRRRPALGVSDVARSTGLSPSTVHRLLTAMSENDLVRQTPDRRYVLGPLLVQLGRTSVPGSLVEAALPWARLARDEADETVGIHVLLPDGRRAVVDQVESHQELRRTYTEMGQPLDLVYGAPGKAMLAFCDTERQEWWLARPIVAATPNTIADPDRLREELDLTRERGWAGSDAERTPGIGAVAAPVFDHVGDVVGALSYSLPVVRLGPERMPRLGERIRHYAWEVSRSLGASESEVARLDGHPAGVDSRPTAP